MALLAGAAALALVAAQPAACIEAPTTGHELAEQAESCLAELFSARDPVRSGERLPIAEKCASLRSALSNAPVQAGWPDSMQDGATAAQLQDIAALLGKSRDRLSAVPFDPNFARLDDILAETLEEQAESGLWERFLRWLEEKMEAMQESQVGRLFERLEGVLPPAWVVEVIIKGALVLALLLALLVVVSILRDEGTKEWWWSVLRARKRGSGDRRTAPTQGLTWSGVTALPPGQQVGAMLRLIIDTLSSRGLFAADRSRTNGELGLELSRRDTALAGLFSRFTRHAEPFLYGARKPAHTDLKGLRADARCLTRSENSTEPSAEAVP